MRDYTEISKEIARLKFIRQENNELHNSYYREKRELECIRSGNIEGMERCINEPYGGSLGVLSRDPLRSLKNVAFCAMAIYARSAIEGGIMPEEAFAVTDAWAFRIDEAENAEELKKHANEMARYFTKLVHDLHNKAKAVAGAGENKVVGQCKNLIYQHMHEKITVQYLADTLYMNPDYLSNLFHRTEGVTITKYILNEKVKKAKNLLMYSPFDCKSISSYLGFATQSHFGKVFKEYTGMTPMQYKEKFGKDEF